jgi:DNA-binding response OmpR family regulator
LYKVISSNGIDAQVVSSGEEALEITRRYHFDLILLDVNMRGIDGFEVVQALRKRGVKTPIIIVSGRKEDYDTLYGLDIGADDYVTKPFNPIVLGAKVKALIMNQLNTIEVAGRNLVVADVIVKYVMKTLRRDLELLESCGKDAFEMLGTEIKVRGEFCGQKFKGFIDRLDSFHEDEARVVDYKTGKVLEDDENINDSNAEAIADMIFNPDMKNWPKIALQFYMYDMLVQSRPEVKGRKICNCVYSTAHLFKEPPVTVPMNQKFYEAVSQRLEAMLGQMYDLSVPFRRTDDEKTCAYCDFRMICGR